MRVNQDRTLEKVAVNDAPDRDVMMSTLVSLLQFECDMPHRFEARSTRSLAGSATMSLWSL